MLTKLILKCCGNITKRLGVSIYSKINENDIDDIELEEKILKFVKIVF
jgi:hypothetical protein